MPTLGTPETVSTLIKLQAYRLSVLFISEQAKGWIPSFPTGLELWSLLKEILLRLR